MPYRTFLDSKGAEWQVWDIVPRLAERRTGGVADRRIEVKPISFAERRHQLRRMTQIRRAILRGTYAQGWLCFDNESEKRRLSPIPGDWTTCSERLLESYAGKAERVSGAHQPFMFNGDDQVAEAG